MKFSALQALGDKHNVVIEGLTWLATILRWPLNDAQLGIKEPKVFQENTPDTITSPAGYRGDTRQDGSTL